MLGTNTPFGIVDTWESRYLCHKCGGLLYYEMPTRKEYCFNNQCEDCPREVEIYSTENSDLQPIQTQFAELEAKLGQIVKTCDYEALSLLLLERRRRLVQRFFASGIMNIDDFLFANDILLFIQKYKSLGIRKDHLTLRAVLQFFKKHSEHLKLTEDLKEGRYLLSRKPPNSIYCLKYYDVIINEIWASYGLVNIGATPDINAFKYHEVIQGLIEARHTLDTTDYGPVFDRLWPFAISALYLVKRNYSSSLKYQYAVTATDLANILSVIHSLKRDELIRVPAFNLLRHFIRQPTRDKDFTDFIAMLTGADGKAPLMFKMNGDVVLDRQTMLLMFILMHAQHLESSSTPSGQQRINQHREEAGKKFETYFNDRLRNSDFRCLPPSTKIAGFDYDTLAVSEPKRVILMIETKFQDPSPSSLSAKTLINQEFLDEQHGLLPQAIKQQKKYQVLKENTKLFKETMTLKNDLSAYKVKPYLVTKFTPLISRYADVAVISEKDFFQTLLPTSNKQ
jgi:hypothetical protein